MENTTHHIWNPLTGIQEFEVDPQSLKASEIPGIRAVWEDRRSRLEGTKQLAEFTEKLSREWAIETGVIENLYEIERGVTQTLIEHGFQAELLTHGSTNQPRDYVLQLLRDQEDALEGVFHFVKNERQLSVSYIKELHAALLRSQTQTEALDARGRPIEVPLTRGEWKKQPNYPVRDGITYLYCPPEHVASEMDRLVSIHAEHVANNVPVDVQAAWLHHRFTQIHPFQDGNGRVARALASLALVKGGLFPFVVTRDDRQPYIKALEAADGGDLKSLVGLVARLQRVQFTKAIAVSETVLADEADVRSVLSDLQRVAEKVAADKRESWRGVFNWAQRIETDLVAYMETIAPDVKNALLRVNKGGNAYVTRSSDETDHYFRAQIIENAKYNLHYYADTSDYRSWVSLNMSWERRARLVFAIHGIGRPFSGSLICAPFLEFRDTDDEGQTLPTLVPVSEEGFVFFYNDTEEQVISRFRPWRDLVIKIALKELSQNL
jgi:fido (protein-threonine AMPylation protein)